MAHVGAGREVGRNTREAKFLWQFWRPSRVAQYPWAWVVLLRRSACKTWQKDQRGKPHVSLADARQTQVVRNRGGKKKIRGNLCKTPVVSNWEVSPTSASSFWNRWENVAPKFPRDWWPGVFPFPTKSWTVILAETCKKSFAFTSLLTFQFPAPTPPLSKLSSQHTVSSKGKYERNHTHPFDRWTQSLVMGFDQVVCLLKKNWRLTLKKNQLFPI